MIALSHHVPGVAILCKYVCMPGIINNSGSFNKHLWISFQISNTSVTNLNMIFWSVEIFV